MKDLCQKSFESYRSSVNAVFNKLCPFNIHLFACFQKSRVRLAILGLQANKKVALTKKGKEYLKKRGGSVSWSHNKTISIKYSQAVVTHAK